MTSDSSDSDEWSEGRVPMQRLRLLFSGVGGEYGDAQDDDASARSESGRPSQSQSPREHFVLKLKAEADGQMESRLEKRRPSPRPPHSTSANMLMDFIARLRQTIKKLPQEQDDARRHEGTTAAAARRHEGAERHRGARDTTATVSREEYLRLEEKYIELNEKYKYIQKKYYWLEKQARILVKMLTERREVAAPAAATRTHDNVDPGEEEAPSLPAPVGRWAGVVADTRYPSPVVRRAGVSADTRSPSPVVRRDGVSAARGVPVRVKLAPGVCLSRAQWQALQAATNSRALVRKLALFLFRRRELLQHRDLKPERMEVLQDVLHQRLADGGFSEEPAKRLTPAAAPRYVQTYRAQLRMQAKRQPVRAREVGTTCGECNKRFRSRSHLDVHARIHSGERPYSCSECGATFMFHTQFNQHARAHGSARARVCPRCGDAFPQLAHLHWHARREHGAAPPAHARRHKAVKPHPEWLRVPLCDADDLAD